eukprot:5363007-Lingulodinium_polyedra.AAC.1
MSSTGDDVPMVGAISVAESGTGTQPALIGTTSVVGSGTPIGGAGAASVVEPPGRAKDARGTPGVGPVPPPSKEASRQFLTDRSQQDVGLYLWQLHGVCVLTTAVVDRAQY